VDGRPECVGIELWKGVQRERPGVTIRFARAAPIGGLDLRSLPLADVLSELWADQRARADQSRVLVLRRIREIEAAGEEHSEERVAVLLKYLRSLIPLNSERPSGVNSHDTEHFRTVADVYGQARRAPTKAVQEHFDCSYSTATKWVAQARRLGFLNKTTPGLASRGRSRQRKGR
jgi:hypothetical protein